MGMGGSVFSRGVKMQVDIITTGESGSPTHPFFVVQFTLHTGPVRRFRRLVDHISSILHTNSSGAHPQRTTERIFASSSIVSGQQQDHYHHQQQSAAPLVPQSVVGQPSFAMARPRRLSDSSVSSACSADSEAGPINPLAGIHQKRSQVVMSVGSGGIGGAGGGNMVVQQSSDTSGCFSMGSGGSSQGSGQQGVIMGSAAAAVGKAAVQKQASKDSLGGVSMGSVGKNSGECWRFKLYY